VTESPGTQDQTVSQPGSNPGAGTRLSEVCATLLPEPGLGTAAAALLKPLIEWTGAARGSILALNPASGRLAIVAAVGLPDGLLGQESAPRPRSISEWVFRNRRGLILNGEVRDQRFSGTAAGDGIESAISLPLVGPEGPLGVLNLARLAPAPVFAATEMAAIEERLGAVAEALARAQFLHLALQGRARYLAASTGSGGALLPPGCSELRNCEITLAHRPAWAPGGDRCDRVPHARGDQSFIMLDPPGNGPLSGATAAFVQGLFITLAVPERSAAGMAARLASEVHARLGPGRATAAWIAQLSGGGELSYCSAGYAAPLWVPADGSDVVSLGCGGPALGTQPSARYEEERLRLLPGDIVLVASDGVLDARGTSDRPFGQSRLAELAAAARGLPLERLVENVIEAVIEYSGRPVPTDDLTILALRFRPGD
jgi:hypothetical protein